MASDLVGRVAIVTGGGKGIGRAVARRLAADGADVVVADIDLAAATAVAGEVEALGRRAMVTVTDVSVKTQVMAMVSAVLEGFGQMDILVNNAGVIGSDRPIEEVPEEEWDRVIAVHLKGTFLCCQAVIPHMKSRRSGSIVNMASVAGKEGNPYSAAYCAAKAAIICLTKSVAREVARFGIRVNSVTPTVIATDLVMAMPEEDLVPLLARIPMGRIGRPEEVAALVKFLVSEEASFATGACYDLSGGRSNY